MTPSLAGIREKTQRPELSLLAEAVGEAKQGSQAAQAAICGAMLWASMASPGSITPVFDGIFRAQLGQEWKSAAPLAPNVALPDTFWDTFQATIDGPEGGYDAGSITQAVAALAAELHEAFPSLSEAAAVAHPGADQPQTKAMPPRIALEELKRCAKGSLARELHSMWVDNGFDPEVLDREALGLAGLSPALRYLNTRILQMHDVWPLVAGYRTTSLHEMAISAFQLAQFGHNYSAMFLSTVAVISHLRQPAAFPMLMQNFAEGWVHGREAPSFMAIAWEDEWHRDLEEVRARHGIQPFAGSFPADLLETLASAS
jgi:ubiquinone biosynthesis protein Coq4